jgi:hypothetical protein
MRPFPQILHHMPQIQNGDGFGQIPLLQRAQRSLAVTDSTLALSGDSPTRRRGFGARIR